MGLCFDKPKTKKIIKIKRIESFKNAKKFSAVFDYNAVNPEELSFVTNDVLLVIEKPNRQWWFAKHEKSSKTGYIPHNFVVDYQHSHTFLPSWHEISHTEATRKLMMADQELGTFIVRPCSDKNHLVISLKCEDTKSEEVKITVKHYKVAKDIDDYYIFRSHKFNNLVDLIKHYSESSDGLSGSLTNPYTNVDKPIIQFRNLEVDRKTFEIIKRIGKGHFSEVFMAKHRTSKNIVAVKILRQYYDDRKTFIKEAKLMHQLDHERIVKLLGVCTLPVTEPMHIITEFMQNGSLLNFIKRPENRNNMKFRDMIIILMEVAEGMSYLESKSFMHRDLRAANILVAEDRSVKVADFGLARVVEEIYVTSEEDYVFPVRWMAQEVLVDNKFTLKSDVWSFGILMYELITYGLDPYPDLTNNQVAVKVRGGYKMPKPAATPGARVKCSAKYYSKMLSCWSHHRERPSFLELFETFKVWADINAEMCIV